MASDDDTPLVGELGRELRALRVAAFSSGTVFARSAGWSQSKVSKIENADVLISEADLARWLDATRAPRTTRTELEQLRESARVQRSLRRIAPGRVAQDGDHPDEASETWSWPEIPRLDAVRASATLREYQPAALPLLVRSQGYLVESMTNARAIRGANGGDDSATVEENALTARLRNRDVLYRDREHACQLIVGEAALYIRPGRVSTMTAQLDELLDLLELPGLDFRVLAFSTPHPAPGLTSFLLYDDRALVATVAGDQWFTAHDQVERFRGAMEHLAGAAHTGDDARALVGTAVTWWREQSDDESPFG